MSVLFVEIDSWQWCAMTAYPWRSGITFYTSVQHAACVPMVELNLRPGTRPVYPRSCDESNRSGVSKNFKLNTIGNHGDRLFFRYMRIPPIKIEYVENRPGNSGASPIVNLVRPMNACGRCEKRVGRGHCLSADVHVYSTCAPSTAHTHR